MLFFHHPKPFLQKAVAVQTVQRDSAAPPDTRVIIVERKVKETPGALAAPAKP